MSKILVIGGSGFVSGTLARTAMAQGHQVWTITRGQRSVPDGVTSLIADRHDAAFAQVVKDAGTTWDMVVDCIGFDVPDAQQDIQVFRDLTPHLVFVSTDFVYDPPHRQFPQTEETDHYLTPDSGTGSLAYGGKKRACELEFINGDTGDMAWSVVRPCHIYGPGSLLGCLPHHGRDAELIAKLKAGETLRLVGGGHFLQQPILAADLSETILSLQNNANTYGEVFLTSGPDILESREFYHIIADILGVGLTVEEVSVSDHLAAHPEATPFMCHRIYDMTKLQASGASVPNTPIMVGLREHVESLVN